MSATSTFAQVMVDIAQSDSEDESLTRLYKRVDPNLVLPNDGARETATSGCNERPKPAEVPTRPYRGVALGRLSPIEGKSSSHSDQGAGAKWDVAEPSIADSTIAFPIVELLARVHAAAPSVSTSAPIDSRAPEWSRPILRVGRRLLPAAALLAFVLVGAAMMARRTQGALPLTQTPQASASAKGSGTESPASSMPTPIAKQAPQPALPPINPRSSLERAAVDAVAEGRYQAAVELYQRLSESEVARPVYTEAARILTARLGTAQPGRPMR